MNINLTKRLEAFVREKVESGFYNNASEVVREALRQMHDKESIKIWSKEEIENELSKVDEDSFTEGFDAQEIIRRGKERLAAAKVKNAA